MHWSIFISRFCFLEYKYHNLLIHPSVDTWSVSHLSIENSNESTYIGLPVFYPPVYILDKKKKNHWIMAIPCVSLRDTPTFPQTPIRSIWKFKLFQPWQRCVNLLTLAIILKHMCISWASWFIWSGTQSSILFTGILVPCILFYIVLFTCPPTHTHFSLAEL